MADNYPTHLEILNAVAGTPPAWTVKVTLAKRVQSAVVIPLGASGGGTGANGNAASVPTIGTDGQTLSFNNNTGGTAQPASLPVAVLYKGT